ncbi:MAG TPA: histidine triad nucleotide-binding protein [Vicinamibacterales bacterium]|jgi:histidine triad (HIT) family protein|nr:histidine triad nucleotide-binding protein [Vicinamibacterales bacterium]
MGNCLFCQIIAGEIPGGIVHQDDDVVAFKDIDPQAPLHVLIVPRRHIATLNDLQPQDDELVGKLHRVAAALAKQHGYDGRGYRTVFNTNPGAGQSVFHIHLHLLAGRRLAWPPG